MLPAAVRITVVVDNTVNQRGLLAEHGLAFWIERGGRRILFDTGQGLVLPHNAEKLGLDLSSVDAIALSHGHYDHTGGLRQTLDRFNHATIFAHLTAFRERFVREPSGLVRSVKAPIESLDWLKARVGRVISTRENPIEIGDDTWLTGEIPRHTAFEDTGGAFFLDETCGHPDEIVDDQAMVLQTSPGTVVVLGCAHAGVVNTLHRACEITGRDEVYAVVGGMHLLSASDERLAETVAALDRFKVRVLASAHCTGARSNALLASRLPRAWRPCAVGSRFDF